MTRIRTAVIPAAGLGTRMLPATEAVPKELLPVGGRPALDWILDEATVAGIEHIVVVSSESKPSIESYLSAMSSRNHRYPRGRQLEIRFVHQAAPLGLGDAVLHAWRSIGDEPIAVLLPDEIMLGGGELLASMLAHHDRQARSMVAVAQVPIGEIGAYGCVELSKVDPHAIMSVTRCVEKPDPSMAPSNFAICGRYLLGIDIFSALQASETNQQNEVQFIAALDSSARMNELLGIEVLPRDARMDIGNWRGWFRANQRIFDSSEEVDDHRSSAVMVA